MKSATRYLLRGGLAERKISPAEKLVLLALVDRADRFGIAWPSQVRMHQDLGLSRNGIQKALKQLQEAGLILKHEPGRQGRSTRWQVKASSVRDLIDRHVKHANSTGQVADAEPANSVGLKDSDTHLGRGVTLARSGPARPSVSQALRAANDKNKTQIAKSQLTNITEAGNAPRVTGANQGYASQENPLLHEHWCAEEHDPSTGFSCETVRGLNGS